MGDGNQNIKGTYFYLAIAGIFMLIICHSWLSEGMFMDGTIYSTISRNMGIGSGTFWKPHFTDTFFPVFNEHPPLAFGLEGLLFRIFGDNKFVERFYSLMTIIITAIIIVKLWKLILKKSSTAWLPVFLWITMGTLLWSSVNNMLENTLVIFIGLSVLFYLKSQQSGRTAYLLLSGLMLSLGFLTKGFVTFTPLAFPFFLWVLVRGNKFSSMVLDTVVLLISALLPLIFLYLFTGAREFFPEYFEYAFYKISNGETVGSRFYILIRLFLELLPSVGIIGILIGYNWKNKHSFLNLNSNLRPAIVFFFLGMAGVLPILITMDQSAHFLLTSFPFFAISFGLAVNPLIETLLERINYNSNGYRFFKIFGVVSLSSGIILSLFFSNDYNRDETKLKDMKAILTQLKENSTINILPEMFTDWSLHTYYARYKNISLDRDLNNSHEYLLIRRSLYSDTINKRFERIDLKTEEFELFRKKISDNSE
jgi:4-amino-4-deoxy-L-arabinose transferase-like glycosyltransferase